MVSINVKFTKPFVTRIALEGILRRVNHTQQVNSNVVIEMIIQTNQLKQQKVSLTRSVARLCCETLPYLEFNSF